MPSGKPSAWTRIDSPARQKMGCTAPELATCSVRFSSFQSANSIMTYCESSRRSCSASFSVASMAAGCELLLRGGAHDAADQRGEQRRGRGLAAHIAEHDGGLVGSVLEKVVEVAADGARRQKAHRHLGVLVLRRRRWAAAAAALRAPWRCRVRAAAPGARTAW